MVSLNCYTVNSRRRVYFQFAPYDLSMALPSSSIGFNSTDPTDGIFLVSDSLSKSQKRHDFGFINHSYNQNILAVIDTFSDSTSSRDLSLAEMKKEKIVTVVEFDDIVEDSQKKFSIFVYCRRDGAGNNTGVEL